MSKILQIYVQSALLECKIHFHGLKTNSDAWLGSRPRRFESLGFLEIPQ